MLTFARPACQRQLRTFSGLVVGKKTQNFVALSTLLTSVSSLYLLCMSVRKWRVE